MTKAEKAVSYFRNNFNCSQGVFTSFAIEDGISEELALKISTCLGGGARCGELCGAVSGAHLVLGLKHGHFESLNTDQKKKAYNLSVEFNKRFKAKNGSVVCKELLGYDLTNPDDAKIIAEKKLFTEFCPKMVADAAEIVEKLLSEADMPNNS